MNAPETRPGELGRMDSQALRAEFSEINRRLRGDGAERAADMVIPRSTLIVGAALWAVLAGMQVWMINRQQTTSDAAFELRGDVKEIKAQSAALKENLGDVKEAQINMDRRLSNMEQRQIQATR